MMAHYKPGCKGDDVCQGECWGNEKTEVNAPPTGYDIMRPDGQMSVELSMFRQAFKSVEAMIDGRVKHKGKAYRSAIQNLQSAHHWVDAALLDDQCLREGKPLPGGQSE